MIWPGCNPGGLWRVLVDAAGREIDSGPLARVGMSVWRDLTPDARIYDGDTGERVTFLPAEWIA